MKIKNDAGTDVDLDFDALALDADGEALTDEQKALVEELFAAGRLDALDAEKMEKLKDISARLGHGQVPELAKAIIVRFDLSWVSIK